jgi:hypothetical protein
MKLREKAAQKGAMPKQRPATHTVLDTLVGAGIDQQPQAIRVTMPCSINQRRRSILWESDSTLPTPTPTKWIKKKVPKVIGYKRIKKGYRKSANHKITVSSKSTHHKKYMFKQTIVE